MKSLLTDLLVVGLSIGSIATFSILLYQDIRGSGDGQGQTAIGKIQFKSNIAQRRFRNAVVWRDIQKDSVIYKLDYIRTDDDSEAMIRLDNGTELQLGESSMILLDIKEKNVELNFVTGSLSARTTGKEGSKGSLKIKSADKTVSVEKGNLKLAKQGDEKLDVTIKEGNASVNVNGKQRTLGKDQKLAISKEGVNIQKIKIKLISPQDNYREISSRKKIPIEFRWTISDAKNSRFELSDQQNFATLLARRNTTQKKTTLILDPGIYFWRVSIVNKENKWEYSETNRVSILYDGPIRTLGPVDKSTISYYDKLPFVNFSWSESSYSNNYTLQIAGNPQLNPPLREIASFVASISVNDLQAGKYFWRVRVNPSSRGGKEKFSPVSSFQIRKLQNLEAPRLVSPKKDRSINRVLFRKGGVSFSWLQSVEIQNSEFILAADPKFQRIIQQRKTPYNFVNINTSLTSGRYYWRVQGSTNQGRKSQFSEIRSIQVVNQDSLELLNPKINATLDYFFVKDKGISFIWKRPETIGEFLLSIARDRDMKNTVLSKKIISYNSNISELEAGTYFWQVRMTGKDNQEIMHSKIHSFRITPPLDNPKILYPENNGIVDMSDRNSLVLDWSEVKGSNEFIISLYQQSALGRKKILTRRQKNSRIIFTELSKLDVGNFYWTLKAVRRDAKGNIIQASREKRYNFKITLQKRDEKPEIISPTIQFIE